MHAAFRFHTCPKRRCCAFKLLIGNEACNEDLAQGIAIEIRVLPHLFFIEHRGRIRIVWNKRSGFDVEKRCRHE
ncbi:unknown [Collinsella sp. CAG:289]|nr:unknown [Collinsella sp. CAG:289]